MPKITKRQIKESEAKLLIEQIKFTPKIIGYTLKEWLNADHVLIAEDDNGQLLGACMNYDISQDWTKIAALYVLEEFRNQGIGKALFYQSVEDAITRQKNIYTISSNPIVINCMNQLEFTTFNSFLNFPKAYKNEQTAFYLHTLQWLTNPYRIQEIIRKQIIYREQEPFIYGLKSYLEDSKLYS